MSKDLSSEDCYYFLYSNCKLGSHCSYRHNTLAKQCSVVCMVWAETGICREDCPFRHSYYHIDKNRKEDACYWETRGGCHKEFCEFKHRDPKKDEWKTLGIKSLNEIKKEKNISMQNAEEEINLEKFEEEKKKVKLLKKEKLRIKFDPERISLLSLRKTLASLKGENKDHINNLIEEAKIKIAEIYSEIKRLRGKEMSHNYDASDEKEE